MNKTFRIAEACLVMRVSQIKYLSFRSELFMKLIIYPTGICCKNLVKIATATSTLEEQLSFYCFPETFRAMSYKFSQRSYPGVDVVLPKSIFCNYVNLKPFFY